jgi:hypothetical protein
MLGLSVVATPGQASTLWQQLVPKYRKVQVVPILKGESVAVDEVCFQTPSKQSLYIINDDDGKYAEWFKASGTLPPSGSAVFSGNGVQMVCYKPSSVPIKMVKRSGELACSNGSGDPLACRVSFRKP